MAIPHTTFTGHTTGQPVDPALLDSIETEIGRLHGRPFVLPELFRDLMAAGVQESWAPDVTSVGWLGADLLEILRSYELGEYLPGTVPFAFDGGGGLYLWDVRTPGDPAVLVCGAGALDWSEVTVVAPSFESFCRGQGRP